MEAAATLLSLQHGLIPPTANLRDPDPDVPFDCVAQTARSVEICLRPSQPQHSRMENGSRRWWLRDCLSVPFIVSRFYYLTHSSRPIALSPPISFTLDEILGRTNASNISRTLNGYKPSSRITLHCG